MERHLSRRRVLRAGAGAVAGLGGIGTAAGSAAGLGGTGSSAGSAVGGGAGDGVDGSYRRIPCRDFSDAEFRTESVAGAAIPERAGGIRPGSQMFIERDDGTAGCTANFVWRGGGPGEAAESSNADRAESDAVPGGDLYIGAAGHCFLTDGPASENAARDHEDGEDVSGYTVSVCRECTVGGVTGLVVRGEVVELGEIVYARQVNPDPDDDSGVGHDFGVVRIPEEKADLVDPSLPQWGGPRGVSPEAVPEGEPVHQYGAGAGNGEVFPTMGTSGVSRGDNGTPESWYAALRASPGDSGSPLVSSDPGSAPSTGDAAAGILTHISWTTPPDADPGEVGIAGTTIGRCKEMAREDVGLDLSVVRVDDSDGTS